MKYEQSSNCLFCVCVVISKNKFTIFIEKDLMTLLATANMYYVAL